MHLPEPVVIHDVQQFTGFVRLNFDYYPPEGYEIAFFAMIEGLYLAASVNDPGELFSSAFDNDVKSWRLKCDSDNRLIPAWPLFYKTPFGSIWAIKFNLANSHYFIELIKSVNTPDSMLATIRKVILCRNLACNQEALPDFIYCGYHYLETKTGAMKTEPPVIKRRSKKIDQDFENLGG